MYCITMFFLTWYHDNYDMNHIFDIYCSNTILVLLLLFLTSYYNYGSTIVLSRESQMYLLSMHELCSEDGVVYSPAGLIYW